MKLQATERGLSGADGSKQPIADISELWRMLSVNIAQFFDRAVSGYRGAVARSNYELGLGSSICCLFALAFEEKPALWWFGISSAIAWAGFYLAALIVALRLDARDGDREYDRQGKFRLSREYWNTESATASKSKKAKSKRQR